MNLDSSLKKLKNPKAPTSLIPGVMARIATEAAQPWWRHAWWIWPTPARVGLLVGLSLCTVGAWGAGQAVGSEWLGPVQRWAEAGTTLWRVGANLVTANGRPLAWLGLWAYAISLGFGTTLWKITKHA